MELKIISKKEDPLLLRTKVEAELTFDKVTPSREEVKTKLAAEMGKDGKLIVVKWIYTARGLKKAKNLSYVYDNEESLKRIEVQKKTDGKAKKEEAKAAPEAKKEEPEKKEAKKAEDKADKKEAKEQPKEAKPEKKAEEKPQQQKEAAPNKK